MSGNTFGQAFRITTFGESHGPGIGVVIDGCPPQLELTAAQIQTELDRRRPGQSELTTPRQESDTVEILSGVFEGKTLGTPIGLLIRNTNTKARDYEDMKEKYRPSHADFTYDAKYGIRDYLGGGRASARETAARVAAGAVAQVLLKSLFPKFEIVGYVESVKDCLAKINPGTVSKAEVESNEVRCPDPLVWPQMAKLMLETKQLGDSLGGIVGVVVRGVPAGLGEPVFDKLEADLAKACLSIPASKGFEIGSGFAGTHLLGSEHNDPFVNKGGKIGTLTNRSGGIQGGISNGEPIVLRVAFKPVATILQLQSTVSSAGEETTLKARGRHDSCVLPRAVPIVEAMVAITLADHLLRWRGQVGI